MNNQSVFHQKHITIGLFLLFTSLIMALPCAAVEVFNKSHGLASSLIYNVSVSENFVWFVSGKDGVSSYDKQTASFKAYSNESGVVAGSEVQSVAVAFGKTYIGLEAGLNVLDAEGNISTIPGIEVSTSDGTNKVKKALTKVNGLWFVDNKLWVCCYGSAGGLFYFDGKSWEEMRFGKSIFNYVRDIQKFDDELWFATAGFGVCVFNSTENSWTVINSASEVAKLPNDTISNLVVSNGVFWVGTGAGVCEIKRDGKKFDVYIHDASSTSGAIKNSVITAIAATEDGTVYVGSTEGLSIYSKGSWSAAEYTDNGGNPLKLKRVFSLASDGNTIWAGANVGLVKIEQ